MPTRPSRRSPRRISLLPALAIPLLLLTGCEPRPAGGPAGTPVDTWPPRPSSPSILDRTTAVPGQPEQQAPTAPPHPEPSPRPDPPGPPQPERQPPPRAPSPHPPGIPGGPGGPGGPGIPSPRAADDPAAAVIIPANDPPPPEPAAPGSPGREAPAPAPAPRAAAEPAGFRELFPSVRADVQRRIVEFDGIVPIDAHDPRTPRVYLEVTVCAPDTKEHESLVMTRALASHIHAALLAIGLKPGAPGSFKWENETMTPVPPEGDPVTVTFIYQDPQGQRRESPALDWVINAETRKPFTTESGGFIFAGSVMRTRQGREVYDADGVGTIVGLTTFGAETVAWREVISPDSHVHTPEWIADREKTPPQGTPVTVRIQPAPKSPQAAPAAMPEAAPAADTPEPAPANPR
jgi:hypothetical protein